MATTLQLASFPDSSWPDLEASDFSLSTQVPVKDSGTPARIPQALNELFKTLTFSPDKYSSFYETYHLHQDLVYAIEEERRHAIEAPAIPTHAPAEALALIKSTFGFSMTRIAEIFGVSRPTVYKWKNENTANVQHQRKLTTLAALGDHWKEINSEKNRDWLLEAHNPGSLVEAMMKEEIDFTSLKQLMSSQVEESIAADHRAKEILGEHGGKSDQITAKPRSSSDLRRERAWQRLQDQANPRRK